MEPSTREMRSRRVIGRFVRAGLIVLAFVVVGGWIWNKTPFSRRGGGASFVIKQPAPAAEAALAPGDLRIYNRDGTVDLILQGNQILAGLSPKTVAMVQEKLEKSSTKDTLGLGGLIASTVKGAVASTIGTHVAYPLSNVRDMRYEDGQLIIEKMDGGETRLFGDTKVNGRERGKDFSEADAERFIAAVRARKNASASP